MAAGSHRSATGRGSTVAGVVLVMLLFTPLVVGAGATSASPRHGPGIQASLHGREDLGEEVASLRTATSRTYFSKQGGFKTAIFLSPVNYLDSQNHWQPIDNRLTATSRGGYQTFANDVRVHLPRTLDGTVALRKHHFWMKLRLRGARAVEAVVKRNRARYAHAFPGVAVRYVAVARGLKQEFVLESPKATSSFRYLLNLSPGLRPRLTRAGGLGVTDRRGRTVFSLPAPFMSDSAPAGRGFSRAVRYGLRIREGHYALTLVASRRWLTSRARRYPVVIDPSVLTSDCTIKSGSPNTSFCTASTIDVGYDAAASSKSRALLPFDLSGLPAGIQVSHSELDLYLESALNTTAIGTTVHGLTRSSTAAATWSTYDGVNAWTSGGGDFTAAADQTHDPIAGTPDWYWWYPTRTVEQIVDGVRPNQGLVLKATDETVNQLLRFSSAESANTGNTPALYVWWYYRTGVRPFYPVVDQQLSDRIGVHVNVGNGNLQLEQDDFATPGKELGFSFGRYWDSLRNAWGYGNTFGMGWVGSDTDFGLSVWSGGVDVSFWSQDGFIVHFVRDDANRNNYFSPPGINATLTRDPLTGNYTLTFNRSGLVYTFDSGGIPLTLKDRNGNTISWTFDSTNWYFTSISDSAGRVTNLSGYVSSQGGNLLTRATDALPRTYAYGYDVANYLLTSYTDPNNGVTGYAYDANGYLTQLTSPKGNVTKFAYDGSGRVTSIIRVTDQGAGTGPTTTFSYLAADASCPSGSVGRTRVTDPNNHTTTYCYDAQLRQTKVIDPLGNARQTTWTANSEPSSSTNATNDQTTYTYATDGTNNLVATRLPTGAETTYAYTDSRHPSLPTSVTDPRGKVSTYTYDAVGNRTSTTLDGTTTEQLTYNTAGQVIRSVDGRGKAKTYTYDLSGNLSSESDPLANTTTYTYDGVGRLLTQVDPVGNAPAGDPTLHTTRYSYDPLDRLLTTTSALGNVTTNAYDADGNRTRLTDANNHATASSYDALQRLTSVTEPDPDGAGPLPAPVTTYGYDAAGNHTSEVEPRGNVPGGNPSQYTTSYAYDAADRLVSTTTPLGGKTTYGYDANGDLTSEVEPRGNVTGANPADYTTTYTYNSVGEQLTETDPLGNPTSYAYDLAGNQTSVTDAKNHTTSSTYDAAGRVLTATAPDGGVTTYTYDGNGNELTRTDASNHTTSSSYDDASQLASVTGPDPDGAGPRTAPVTSHTYDSNGNLKSIVDPNGNLTPAPGDGTTTYTYDADNQLKTIDYSDSTPDVNFNYDAVGNRTSMIDDAGTVSYGYDGLDRLTSATRAADTFSYAYDAAGNVTSRTYPGASALSYGYDRDGRLSGVTNYATYGYDAAGNLTTTTLPSANGYLETRRYDRAGRLLEVKNAKGASVLSDFNLTLDAVGNPTQVAQTGAITATTTYGYDVNDRLTSVCFQTSCPGGGDPFIRWTYDRVGNRLTEARASGTTNYSYDARDELTAAGATSYSYDQNGNETAAGSRTFSYDLANRVVSTTAAGATTTYSYDGDGNRLQESRGSQPSDKTNYQWDTNGDLAQLAVERDGNNSELRRYTYGERRISMTGGLLSVYYYHYDAIGSVRNVTSSSGASEWTYSYEPFGKIRTETRNDPLAMANAMKFTGELLDPTGLYYLRARQYDAGTGRFLTVDPVGEEDSTGLSSYSYVNNQPTVLTDPSGTRRCDPHAPSCPGSGGSSSRGCALRPGYPLRVRGKINGRPGQGKHDRNYQGYVWQDDDAYDLNVRVGTDVCAPISGRIGDRQHTGPLDSQDPRLAGRRLYVIRGTSQAGCNDNTPKRGDCFYLAHLSKILVQPNQPVRQGQRIGKSGKASGVAHLHIAKKPLEGLWEHVR